MCIVSAVTDYYRTNIWTPPIIQPIPWQQYEDYLILKKQAIQIDVDHNQAGCAKPEIEEWEREIEEAAKAWKEQNP